MTESRISGPRNDRSAVAKERSGSRRRFRRATTVFLVLGIAALLLAACGSASGPGVASAGSTTSTTPPSSNTKAPSTASGGSSAGNASGQTMGIGGVTLAYSQCMRSHGFPNFPDPNSQGQVNVSGVDPNSAPFKAAQRACTKFVSGASGKPPTAAQQQKMLANALKFAQCMRAHGITDYPDPQVSGGGISTSINGAKNSDLNPKNPRFRVAQKTCQSIRGAGSKQVTSTAG